MGSKPLKTLLKAGVPHPPLAKVETRNPGQGLYSLLKLIRDAKKRVEHLRVVRSTCLVGRVQELSSEDFKNGIWLPSNLFAVPSRAAAIGHAASAEARAGLHYRSHRA